MPDEVLTIKGVAVLLMLAKKRAYAMAQADDARTRRGDEGGHGE